MTPADTIIDTGQPRRTAMITGGNRGIGASIAMQLAIAGHSVVITYRNGGNEARKAARQITAATHKPAHTVHLNLEHEATIVPAVEEAVELLDGVVDVLVNNAGYADMSAPEFTKISRETLIRTVQTNVVGPFLLTQAVVPHIPDGGSIINIGSCLGSRVPTAGFSTYAMSKAAVSGFTRALSRDLGSRAIRVNEVAPGSVNTEMNSEDGPSADFQRATTTLGRYANPDEIAQAVVFLASDNASYITGTSIAVDAGTNT